MAGIEHDTAGPRVRHTAVTAVLTLTLLATLLTGPPAVAAVAAVPPANCPDAPVTLTTPERGADGTTPRPRAHVDGRYTPILLVHGWNGKPSMWGEPTNLSTLKTEPKVNHSLLGNLQKLTGAAVYTLDYHSVAHRWFLDPEGGGNLFLAAEKCLTGQEAFRGHRLVVVAHSMGGLITRWALSDKAPDGVARRDRVGLVVTLGTPYQGSLLAALGTALADGALADGTVLDKRIAPIAEVVHQLLTLCEVVRIIGCDQLNHLVDMFAAMRAFATGSDEMNSLDAWPPGTRVSTLATRTELENIGGMFFAKGPVLDVGDVVVAVDSATSGEHPEKIATCRLTASKIRDRWNTVATTLGITADVDVPKYWRLALFGDCFHSNEARLIELTNEVLGSVGDELSTYDPAYAYTTATALSVHRGERMWLETPGKFTGDPVWTHGAGHVAAVTDKGDLVVVDVAERRTRTVKCGCRGVAAIRDESLVYVNGTGRAFTLDLGSGGGPRALALRLPAPLRAAEARAGLADGFLLFATRPGIDSGAMLTVTLDGQGTVVKDLPEVAYGTGAAAGDGRYAYAVVVGEGDCAHPSPIYVTDATTGSTFATDTSALVKGFPNGDTFPVDMWWGRDKRLYATLVSWECDPMGGIPLMPPGLWRLDDRKWVSVDGGPLHAVRQLGAGFKIVTTENQTLYRELNGGRGVKVAPGVIGLAAPPWTGPADPAAAPTGTPRTTIPDQCLSKADFKKQADKQGVAIFEGSSVRFTVTSAVVCERGWAYATVGGYSIDYIVFRRSGTGWTWAADPYWQQYGGFPDICASMPPKIRTAMRCP